MIAVVQRVLSAAVAVDGEVVGCIERGILALVAVERGDEAAQATRLADRILRYRIFPDSDDRMNLNVVDVAGGLLLVSQFTLAADTASGNRPSFTPAADPASGRKWFDYFVERVRAQHANVACGQFGANMQVSLINDGPVTFILRA